MEGKHAAGDAPRAQAESGPESLILNGAHEAERVLEEQAALHPTYADARWRLGLLKLAHGQTVLAEREFEEALGIHPGYRAALWGLRFARLLQGRTVEDMAGESEPPACREEAAWAAVEQAYRLRASGADPLAAFPEDGDPLLRLHYAAYFALERGDERSAAEHLRAAAAASATSAAILGDLGYDPARPESLSTVAPALLGMLWSPLAADLYAYLGRIYARNGLREEAARAYGRAFLTLPDEGCHARHEAELAIAFGEEEQAIELLTRAIAVDPTCVGTRIALGFEYAAQGFVDEARIQFEVAATLAPGYADVRYNLGLLYSAEDKSAEAMRQFRQALAINPSFLPARRSLAALLERLGRHEEALREADRLVRQGFVTADLLVQMARSSLALERMEEALDYLLRAEALQPDHAPTYHLLGQVYRRKGQKNKARSAWRRYLAKTAQADVGPSPARSAAG